MLDDRRLGRRAREVRSPTRQRTTSGFAAVFDGTAPWLARMTNEIHARRARSTVEHGLAPAGTSTAPDPDMMTKLTSILLGTCLIASAGCAHESGTGAAVGAGAGGIIGAAAGGVGWGLFGAAVGGLLGYGVGQQVEAQNEQRMAEALAAGQPTTWSADQGHVYTLEPQPPYYYQGRQCRRFRLLAHVDGQPREVHGTACQQPNGQWEALNTY
ncbi:MAG TPA: hypothetical protein VF516_01180 [Kofleriaceae bacterium]